MNSIVGRVLVVLFVFGSVLVFGQPGGGPPPDPGQPVPFSGLEWLLFGGVILGLKRLNFFNIKIGKRGIKP